MNETPTGPHVSATFADHVHKIINPAGLNRAQRRALGGYRRGRVCPPLRGQAVKAAAR